MTHCVLSTSKSDDLFVMCCDGACVISQLWCCSWCGLARGACVCLCVLVCGWVRGVSGWWVGFGLCWCVCVCVCVCLVLHVVCLCICVVESIRADLPCQWRISVNGAYLFFVGKFQVVVIQLVIDGTIDVYIQVSPISSYSLTVSNRYQHTVSHHIIIQSYIYIYIYIYHINIISSSVSHHINIQLSSYSFTSYHQTVIQSSSRAYIGGAGAGKRKRKMENRGRHR